MSKEKKYTSIHNDVIEALGTGLVNLSSTQFQLICFIGRKTWGFHTSRMRMGVRELSRQTNIPKRTLVRAFEDLVRRNIIEVHDFGSGTRARQFGINGDPSTWQSSVREIGTAKTCNGVRGNGTTKVPKVGTLSVRANGTTKVPKVGTLGKNSTQPEPHNHAARSSPPKIPKETIKETCKETIKEKECDFQSVDWIKKNPNQVTRQKAYYAAIRAYDLAFGPILVKSQKQKVAKLLDKAATPAGFLALWLISVKSTQHRRLQAYRDPQKTVFGNSFYDLCQEYAQNLERVQARKLPKPPSPPTAENWTHREFRPFPKRGPRQGSPSPSPGQQSRLDDGEQERVAC